jgi:hypothetical protein
MRIKRSNFLHRSAGQSPPTSVVATALATQPLASDRTGRHPLDDAPYVSSHDASQRDCPDGFLPTRNRKVVGSNPTSGSTNQQLTAHIALQRPALLASMIIK